MVFISDRETGVLYEERGREERMFQWCSSVTGKLGFCMKNVGGEERVVQWCSSVTGRLGFCMRNVGGKSVCFSGVHQ